MALLTRRFRIAAAVLALASCAAAHAERASETDLKTAYVYNFIVLSTWPASTPSPLRFCVAGGQEAAAAFRMLSGKVAGNRTLMVGNVPSPDRAHECDVLFLPAGESGRLDSWLAAAAKRPTLTISDQAPGRGAVLNLRLSGDRIVFDVDTRAAASAGIGLSSQLIKLAVPRQ
jgi:uncharacterized protein DUF4154